MRSKNIISGIITLSSVLVSIAAFNISAAAGEADFGQMIQEYTPEKNMPVGGWVPTEFIRLDDDAEINTNPGGLRSSRSVINSDPDSAFTKGVGSVGYNSLNEAQRSVYASINTAALQFHYATEDLQPTLMTISGRGEEFYYIAARIDYADHGLTTNEMYQTFIAYDYDHPAYYWIANQTLCSDREFFICTCAEYASAAERSRINNLIENGVRKYAAVADKCGLTLDKITAIHDMVVTDVDYAYKSDGTTAEDAKWAHSVQGVFDSAHSHVVCEGYADVFALMMNYLGIPNYYIVGYAGSGGAGGGGGHAWNAVSDDGGLTYMYMDLTWDDRGDNGYYYRYFGMPRTDFENNHFKNTSSGEKELWLYDIPENLSNTLEGTYYYRSGFYYTGGDSSEFAERLKTRVCRFGRCISFLACGEQGARTVMSSLVGGGFRYYSFSYLNVDYFCPYIQYSDQTVDISSSQITLAKDIYRYTGYAVKPVPLAVTCNGVELIPGLNYEVSYEDNVAVGENSAKVVVTGTGNFGGACRKAFSISRDIFAITITGAMVSLDATEFTYDKTQRKPGVTVSCNDTVLAEGTDYSLTYSADTISAGTAKVTVTGMGDYTGSVEKQYDITPRDVAVKGLKAKNKSWDGTSTAEVDITDLELDGLIEGDDLSVEWESASFADADAGSKKAVVIKNIGLSGESAGNYRISDPAGADLTVYGDIYKVESGFLTSPSMISGLGYNGTAQTLVSAGTASGGRILYSLNGTDFSGSADDITAVHAGNYTVYYKIAGDENHLDSAVTTKSLSISPRTVSVSGIRALNKEYDGNETASLDTSEVVIDRLIAGDLIGIRAAGTFADKNAGADRIVSITDISITGEYASDYCLAEDGNQTETTASILAREVTVKADDKLRIYGGTDPVLTATVTGLANGESSSLIRYSLERSGGENVGEYVITPSGSASQGNYTVSYQTGTLTINRAPLVVKALDREKEYGARDPVLSTTVTGLKGKDTRSLIQFSVEREAGEEPGSYAITVSGEKEQGNYTVSYESGTLRINEKKNEKEEDENVEKDENITPEPEPVVPGEEPQDKDKELTPVVPESEQTPVVIPMTGVALDVTDLTVRIGETATLTLSVQPSDSTESLKDVRWDCSRPDVASVADGVVTARSMGTCRITAYAGEFRAVCTVTVPGRVVEKEDDEEYSSGYTPVIPDETEKLAETTIKGDDGESRNVAVPTTYDSAINYTGSKIIAEDRLNVSVDTTDVEKVLPKLNEGWSPADLFEVSYVDKNNLNAASGKAYFYAKITLSKKKDLKNAGLSDKAIKVLKKQILAINKKLKAGKCFYTINKRSLTDGTVTVSVKKTSAGAIKTSKKGQKISKVKWVKFYVPETGKTIKLSSKDYTIAPEDAEKGLVRITGKRNFSGSVVVSVQ